MKHFLRACKELCFPPCCVGCGERLEPSVGGKAVPYFCERCAPLWQRCLVGQCNECHRAFFECDCQTALMKRAGSEGLLKVAPYDTERAGDPMVYALRNLKKHPRQRVLECLASEMSTVLKKHIEKEEKWPVSHTVIVHIPRAGRKIRLLGFDHAELLARRVSQLTGIPYLPLLRRARDGSEQKKLTQRARQENLKNAFSIKESPRGLGVILVDDVVTTGAGMAEATRLLRRNGALRVLCLSAALTPKRKRRTRENT